MCLLHHLLGLVHSAEHRPGGGGGCEGGRVPHEGGVRRERGGGGGRPPPVGGGGALVEASLWGEVRQPHCDRPGVMQMILLDMGLPA